MQRIRPVILISLDGWGVARPGPGNAIASANLPNMTKFTSMYPNTTLLASGDVVGLPHGEDGNSEVGHLNMGAGRIIYQNILRINAAIADGSFLRNEAFLLAADHVKRNNSKFHIMGLMGSGSVHSYQEHVNALLWFAKENGLPNVMLHLFTDGRDAPPQEAITKVAEIEARLQKLGVGKIASVSGRYYAMDRDNRWERIEKAYNALVVGEGKTAHSAKEAIEQSYAANITDEFIEPTVIINPDNTPVGTIDDNDAVVFVNFRPDRARQLTKAFVIKDFEQLRVKQFATAYHQEGRFEEKTIQTFQRKKMPDNVTFVAMTEYEKGIAVSSVAFPTEEIKMPLARVISERNLRQLHLAETEKYAHITYFFNGYREAPYLNEDRLEIPSPHVATYDLQPEMSSRGITDTLILKVQENKYDFVMMNFAAPDMVGHTGVLEATIKAVQCVDECLGRIVDAVLAVGGAVIITADHGNAEQKLDPISGEVDTNHTSNPVPFIAIAKQFESVTNKTLQQGILADVSPSILALMEIPKPFDMTGRNLLASILK